MFEDVITPEAKKALSQISKAVEKFYLAGGTGLALQLGHRLSIDLDFFSFELFNLDVLIEKINPEKILFSDEGTIHCEKNGVKLSFLFYREPLVYSELRWLDIKMADWKDIAAEKIKAISQRGAKKDFYDIYAVLKLKLRISELCEIFKKRFTSSGINKYHVLKSLVYFEDAEDEPEPIILIKDNDWQWEKVKGFFEGNVREFEKGLIRGIP
ncbi:MAG: nucleotidyl transferase AbiEii/AbiGii toxin family protein [bacterium]